MMISNTASSPPPSPQNRHTASGLHHFSQERLQDLCRMSSSCSTTSEDNIMVIAAEHHHHHDHRQQVQEQPHHQHRTSQCETFIKSIKAASLVMQFQHVA